MTLTKNILIKSQEYFLQIQPEGGGNTSETSKQSHSPTRRNDAEYYYLCDNYGEGLKSYGILNQNKDFLSNGT